MAKSVLIGGIVGGVILFGWGAVAHMVLPIGELGMKGLPNGDAAVASLVQNVPEPGMYGHPWIDPATPKDQKSAAMKEMEARYEKGPSLLLVWLPQGGKPMMPGKLATQLGSDVLCGLLAAMMLCAAASGIRRYAGRVLFVAGLGFLATLVVNVPYWNWYEFPCAFTIGAFLENTIGFALAGLAMAAIVKPCQGEGRA